MLDYANFINQKTTFTPRLIIKIGGEDVSHLYVEGSLKTDQVLDTPSFNVWTTGTLRFSLRNTDNRFNTRNTSNFFTELGRDASGWRTFVIVSVIFENDTDAPTTPITFFSGFVEQVVELPHVRSAEIFALDFSVHLQQAPLDNFGTAFEHDIVGPEGTPNYSALSPIYNFPENAAPISYRSVSIEIADEDITVLTSLPEEGIFSDYKYAGIDYDAGTIHFGGEPPNESSTRIRVTYKGVYRYRTPELLISEMLDHIGIYDGVLTDTEKLFAKSLLESPIVESAVPVVSSHGRPSSNRIYSVIRWIDSGLRSLSETFYLGGDRNLFTYVRRNEATGKLDEYEILTQCPDTDASILQFLVHGEDFYVLTVSSWGGIRAKLWWVTQSHPDRSGEWYWDEIMDAEATAAHFYDDLLQGSGQQDVVGDNRKNLVIHGDYIYYLYDNNVSGNLRKVGLRRVGLRGTDATQTARTLFQVGVPGRYSVDFAIVGSEIYVFYCLRNLDSDSYFEVKKANLNSLPGMERGDWTSVYSETWKEAERSRPAMVSDVVHRDGDFYFVLTYSRRVTRRGYAELCKLDPSASADQRTVLKHYDDMLFAARSLIVHREDRLENIYFVEGTWISKLSHVVDYPTFEDCGHLFRLDLMDTIWDLGPAWRSHRDKDEPGRGMHTAFASNIHRAETAGSEFTAGTLHFVAGYGLPARYPSQSDRDAGGGSIQSLFSREVIRQDNWVWLQYGKKLSTKVPVFPTNGKYVWPLIEELARIVDYEVGWVPGDREIAAFKETYPTLTLEPKSYLFFKRRGDSAVEVSVDESVYVNLGSQLDTVQIFNSVSMSFGGHIHFSEDILETDDGEQPDLVRNYHIFTDCLSGKDRGWAAAICDRVLSRQKERRLKTRLPLKFSPHLQLGDLLEITSEYHSLVERRYRVTEVAHSAQDWQTEVECREDLEIVEPLSLPDIEDREYLKDVLIGIDLLPGASGGEGPYTYSLSNAQTPSQDFNSDRLFVGVEFLARGVPDDDDVDPPRLTGTPTGVATLVVRYTVKDGPEPAMDEADTRESVSKDFRITVVDSPLVLPAVDLVHIRKDCEHKIVLPVATGGISPYSYVVKPTDSSTDALDLVPALDFDEATREIIGVPGRTDKRRLIYEVSDFIETPAEQPFTILIEEPATWSGLYFRSNKVGVLDNNGNHLREYDYSGSRKARSVPDPDNGFRIQGDLLWNDGDWTGCCATGTHRIFLDNENNRGVFYNSDTEAGRVDLGDGDWRDVVVLPSGNVGFLDFDTATFRVYSIGRSRVASEDLVLQYAADVVSAYADPDSNRLWTLVRGSDSLIAWNVTTGDLVPSDFQQMIEGVTDWEALAWTGTHFLLLRAEATRLFAVSAAGVRSVENDLQLYG
ncbi:hypothetical protein F4Z99_10650 [Candidatus Poribacteria bacterium]|nr:hypothetical protein [Candidatus Poribacteria bacterium]